MTRGAKDAAGRPSGPELQALEALVLSAFDFLCTRRVDELLDPADFQAALDALDGARAATLFGRLASPMREALLERLRGSARPLAAAVPPPLRERLLALVGAPLPLPGPLVEVVARSSRIRATIRSSLQDAVASVFGRPGAGGGGRSGGRGALGGVLGWSARAAGAAGRGIFGGLGDELGGKLEERVRELVDLAVGLAQARIAEWLGSEEGARAMGRGRRDALEALLERTEAEAAALVERMPMAEMDALAVEIVARNLGRPEVREALRAQAAAVLGELSQKTLGELLDELGLREPVRQAARRRGTAILAAFVRSDAFARGRPAGS